MSVSSHSLFLINVMKCLNLSRGLTLDTRSHSNIMCDSCPSASASTRPMFPPPFRGTSSRMTETIDKDLLGPRLASINLLDVRSSGKVDLEYPRSSRDLSTVWVKSKFNVDQTNHPRSMLYKTLVTILTHHLFESFDRSKSQDPKTQKGAGIGPL